MVVSLNGEENGEVWRMFYERRDLKQALTLCENRHQIRILSRVMADDLFAAEKFEEAAQLYGKSDCRAEEVVAKFCLDA